MNRTSLKVALLAAAAVLACASSGIRAAAQAATSPPTAVYNVELEPEHAAGAYDGLLTLHYETGGIISGTFRPADGSPRRITGGTSADGIWLDLGLPDHTIIEGISNVKGTLKGETWIDDQPYSFEARPVKGPGG
ncbi:MAG TPA: hypothetical protein VME66_03495 [Candidatus Acidoferrales bacterium]|nr:hypothetical protein [Candidatus Acidoferrales bacterium]